MDLRYGFYKVNTLIAIPYNPYEPKPYNRWTLRGMLDLDKELKVAGEFWDFVGGKGAYKLYIGIKSVNFFVDKGNNLG